LLVEAPEVAELLPELDDTPLLELKPELLLVLEELLFELAPLELEPVETFPVPEEPEELEGVLPVELDVAACVDPGKRKATTPAANTLLTPTAAVAERTLARPRRRAATALTILLRFMTPILGAGSGRPLRATSEAAMSYANVSRARPRS
jgi:hypothetical protein